MQQPPQQQPPSTLNSAPPFPSNTITTEQIQKYLDDNRNLILAIMENQNLGKLAECAQYQSLLQKNLMYLAAIADAQPQPSAPTQMQMPQQQPQAVAQQVNYMQQQQPQAVVTPQQQQGSGSGSGSGGPKLPFQLNSLRPQDQQQFLHMQQQQQQQMQMQMGAVRPNNGIMHHHHPIHHQPGLVTLPTLTDPRKQDASDAASAGDNIQTKPASARGAAPTRD